jgi:hypothetical protein
MNGVELARDAPCIFCTIGILDIKKCKWRCLSPFVALVMLEGIVPIFLVNFRTRFFLRGVGYDAPSF